MNVMKERWECRELIEISGGCTGIFVRAQLPDETWDSVDIAFLEKESLIEWLKSRGGNNPWAEEVVCILLGHIKREKE